MQKLKAFTLMELLIGMIISSIVISFCYMSYTLIYKQYQNYKIIKKELVEALQFNSVLGHDIVNADRVLFSENKLTLINNHEKGLEYNFSEAFILRKAGEVTDTFKLAPMNIVSDYIKHESMPGTLLVSFSFDAVVAGDSEHFQFSKRYDAQMIVNDNIQSLREN